MMKKILALFLAAAFAVSCWGNHQISVGDQAKMVIVYNPLLEGKVQKYDHIYRSRNTSAAAARQLAGYLKEVTGADFKVIKESQWQKEQPAFVIGDTEFARSSGIEFKKFAPEEYLYKSEGKNIIIGGGFNFGQIIAINKLMEDHFSCRYLAHDARHFPLQLNKVLPKINKRSQPSFSLRAIYTINQPQKIGKRLLQFQRFNRGTVHAPTADIVTRKFSAAHSIYSFVNPDVHFKTHPEYFSMDAKGKRFHGDAKRSFGGEICYSNADAAKIAAAELRKYITADRKTLPKELWPTVYNINHADATDFLCLCPECKKITAREGSEAAILLMFVNNVARSIAKDFPEVKIYTSAYSSSELAPATIKPEKNVYLEYCDLYTRSDCFRPLTHAINKNQLEVFKSWERKGIKISKIYDYWNMGGRWYFPPHLDTMAQAIKGDLQFFYKSGIRQFYTEAEHAFYDVDGCFYELQLYVGLQLLDDITKDDKALIREFITLYYGKAAPWMQKYYDRLSGTVYAEKQLMNCGNAARGYQTLQFVQEVYDLLHKAHAAVAVDSPCQMRVERELLPVLRLMLYNTNLRGSKSKTDVLNEYRKLRIRQMNYLYTPVEVKKLMPKVEEDILRISFDFATPEKFAHIPEAKIHKFSAIDFNFRSHVNDPESDLKKVVRVGKYHNWQQTAEIFASKDKKYIWRSKFGVTDQTHRKTRTINLAGKYVPQDEKYHWYCIRNASIGPQSAFWGWNWWTICRLDKVYMDGADNIWDVWFRAKITGPAYVKGSRKENNIFLECVILTPPGTVK